MPPFHSRSTGAVRAARISSVGVRTVSSSGRPSAAAAAGGQRDRLGRAAVDAAALGQQRGVVVRPRAARQAEQPLALGVGGGRVRVGVDEHVPVVEGHDEPGRAAQQHAVAEHVAAHVADADHGERVGVDVGAELVEVEPDRLPRAAGGDAHGLVVVALRAARGERVAEPEAPLERDGVGHVGERGRALVRGDDEVGVVAVVADHVARRHDRRGVAAGRQVAVVGDVEQGPDEGPVALGPGLVPGLAVLGRVGQALADEAALGPGGHDDDVLHLLRLDQAEDLGAEVLQPVRPAQPAAGDGAEAQVDALDVRAAHPDLVRRARLGQVGDLAGVELDRDRGVGPPVRAVGVEAGPLGGDHGGQQRAEDPVLGEVVDVLQGGPDRGDGALAGAEPGRGRPLALGLGEPVGGEAGLEDRDEQPRHLGVGAQDAGDVLLGERRPGLAEVAAVGPQHDDLPPGEPGLEHEPVEPVGLRRAGPGGDEGVGEPAGEAGGVGGRARGDGDRGQPQAEVVDVVVDRLAGRRRRGRSRRARGSGGTAAGRRPRRRGGRRRAAPRTARAAPAGTA